MAVLLKLINMESMARTKNRDWVGQTALTPDFNVAHLNETTGEASDTSPDFLSWPWTPSWGDALL